MTGNKIEEEVASGAIRIEDFDVSRLNPNSYNYRLGETVLEVNQHSVETEHKISKSGFVLEPNTLYLGHTKESIGSIDYAMSLIGRSSTGRLGLFVQISANLGHQGSNHRWTLELRASHRIRVFDGMELGQVTFWKTKGKEVSRSGHFSNFSHPKKGRIER